MTDIPINLQRPEFKFIRVAPNSKKPIDLNWTSNKDVQYSFDSDVLKNHLNNNGNYGVVCGINGLMVIDADTQELSDLIMKSKLPRTLVVKSSKDFPSHFYYFTDDELSRKKPLTKDGKQYGDLQASGSQIICPGSTHPTGKKYEVFIDAPIAEIKFWEIQDVLSDYLIKNQPIEEKKEHCLVPQDNKLRIIDLVDTTVLIKRGEEHQGTHPIHGSETGANFSINSEKNSWHCFRCDSGGGPLSWIAVKHGIIRCNEAKPRALIGDKFKKTLEIANKEYGYDLWEDEPDIFQMTENGRKIIPYKASNYINQNIPIITTSDNDSMYYYDGGIYKPGSESLIKKLIQEKATKEVKIQTINEIIAHVQRSTYIDREQIGGNKKMLHLLNGILNTDTLEVIPFSKEHISLIQLPVNYNPKSDCPLFKKFLSEVLPEESDRQCIQELFGYFLNPEYNHHRAFMFIGEGGNGKSTLINVMRAFLGNNNISAVQLQDLEENQFMAAQLYGKVANLYPDMSANSLNQTSSFKALCGGDMITVDSKFGKPFQFVNRAKLVFSCNTLPEIKNPSPADFRRWIVIQFNQRFEGKTDDKHLINKITTEDELSGILNWALDGLKRLNEKDTFTYAKSMEEMQVFYTRLSDPVGCFAMDALKDDWDGSVLKNKLWSEFLAYSKKLKLKRVSEKSFWIKIKETFPHIQEIRGGTIDNRQRIIHGISFFYTYVQHVQDTPLWSKVNDSNSLYKENHRHVGQPGQEVSDDEELTKNDKISIKDIGDIE